MNNKLNKDFKQTIKNRPGGENLSLCYSCGSCTATCPVSEQRESFNPRLMIKKCLLGFSDEILEGKEIWQCIQCRRCVSACPQNVRFADIVKVLRELAVEKGNFSDELAQKLDSFDKKLLRYRLNSVDEVLEGNKEFAEIDLTSDLELEAGDEENA